MTISRLDPLPAGNALRLTLTPPAGARWWRVLRRADDAFAGADDPTAVTVSDAATAGELVDAAGLANGTAYFYRAYYWDGLAWNASATASAVPAASYRGDAVDPLLLLRDRLAAGLAVEVARGTLTPPAGGAIPVLAAPFALSDPATMPAVWVWLQAAAPLERALGDQPFLDMRCPDGAWDEAEGWLDQITLGVAGLCADADQRHALRRALKRIIQANLAVFKAAGLDQIGYAQGADQDLASAAGTLCKTAATFDCVAPSFITAPAPALAAVDLTIIT